MVLLYPKEVANRLLPSSQVSLYTTCWGEDDCNTFTVNLTINHLLALPDTLMVLTPWSGASTSYSKSVISEKHTYTIVPQDTLYGANLAMLHYRPIYWWENLTGATGMMLFLFLSVELILGVIGWFTLAWVGQEYMFETNCKHSLSHIML